MCNFRARHQTLYFILTADDCFHSKVASENFFSVVALDWGIDQLGDILVNHTAAVLYSGFEIVQQNLSRRCRVWVAEVLLLTRLNSR